MADVAFFGPVPGSDGRIGEQTDRRQPLDTTGPDGSAGAGFYLLMKSITPRCIALPER